MKHFILRMFDDRAICNAKAWSRRSTTNESEVTCKTCLRMIQTEKNRNDSQPKEIKP